VHRDQAGVSPFDSAVQGGDAVWEGLRLYDGRIFALEEHLARLRSSALALAFDDIPAKERIIEEIRVGRRGRNRSVAVYDFTRESANVTRGEPTTFRSLSQACVLCTRRPRRSPGASRSARSRK